LALSPCGVTTSTGERPQATNRVLRGGSWNNNGRNCRSANRNRNEPGNRNNNNGFRVALARSRWWMPPDRPGRFPVPHVTMRAKYVRRPAGAGSRRTNAPAGLFACAVPASTSTPPCVWRGLSHEPARSLLGKGRRMWWSTAAFFLNGMRNRDLFWMWFWWFVRWRSTPPSGGFDILGRLWKAILLGIGNN